MKHGVHSSQLETGGNLKFDCTDAPSIRRHEPQVLPLVWVVVAHRGRSSQKVQTKGTHDVCGIIVRREEAGRT